MLHFAVGVVGNGVSRMAWQMNGVAENCAKGLGWERLVFVETDGSGRWERIEVSKSPVAKCASWVKEGNDWKKIMYGITGQTSRLLRMLPLGGSFPPMTCW